MPGRISRVTGHTTLDLVEGEAVGADWSAEALGVLDATAARREPDHVELRVELDGTDLAGVEGLHPHADVLRLTPEQARAVAEDLRSHADRVAAASRDPTTGDVNAD
ncbi:DUF6360 family protein [Haloparvum sedimenti]|uniref:DUF6360 family protein n=1 Tax=Haloparvum sedimenti TaxID=1678448 RepID=UPI00071E962B|nr:DUF6360 family protein [Haloparvum sedimenti]